MLLHRHIDSANNPPTDDPSEWFAFLDDKGVLESIPTQSDVGVREGRLHVVVEVARTPVVVDTVVEGQPVDVLADQVVVGVTESGELGAHQTQRVAHDGGVEQLHRAVGHARWHGAVAEVPAHDRLLHRSRDEPQRVGEQRDEPMEVGDERVDDSAAGRACQALDGREQEHTLCDAAGRELIEKVQYKETADGMANEDQRIVYRHVLLYEVFLVSDLTFYRGEVFRRFVVGSVRRLHVTSM